MDKVDPPTETSLLCHVRRTRELYGATRHPKGGGFAAQWQLHLRNEGGHRCADHSSALDSHGEPEVTSAESPEVEQWDWQPNSLHQAPDVRDFAPDAQAGATSTDHPPNSPCSISSNSSPSSLGATLLPHAAAAGAAQSAEPCVSVIAPGSPRSAIPGWNQNHVVARSAVPNAPLDTPQDVDLASDDSTVAR